MNRETAHAIRDQLRGNPTEIRVLCPRGHFIAHIGLYVHEHNNGEPGADGIRMHPRGPDKEYVGDLRAGHHGFSMALDGPNYNAGMRCTNKRCKYSGSFNFFELSTELAAAALSGHAEYRLTR